MERLSTLDASFLRIETPNAHMHVGWLAEVELPSGSSRLSADDLRAAIATKLHLTPRFRQRLREAPLGEPFWVDDPGFRLERHVREARGQGSDLGAISGGFLSRQLDRRHPLWEILVVPRTGPGRAAVLGKVHHAMVDGIAAVQLGMLLFDLEPNPERPSPVPWQPQGSSPVRVAAGAVTDSAVEQFRAAGRMATMGLRPGRTLRAADSARRAAFSLAGELARPAPETFLRAKLSPERALVPSRIELARAKRLARAAGVKLNDVVLAVVSGALRDLAELLEEPEREAPRAMVPVSVRGDDEGGGNRITFAFIDLPTDLPSAEERLAAVVEQMAELKSSGFASGSDMLLRSVSRLPGGLKTGVAKMAASPRTYSITVSNVPGPTVPLFAAGARVASIHPVIPISEGHALSIGVLSYDGLLHFGVYADPNALPEAADLERLLPRALERLGQAVSSSSWPAGQSSGTVPGPSSVRSRRGRWPSTPAAEQRRRPRGTAPRRPQARRSRSTTPPTTR